MHSELIEECEICGGYVDANQPGYYKSVDERFRHKVCHENGDPPKGYVWKYEPQGEQLVCMNHQYYCGHIAFGPLTKIPDECPKCEP